MARKPDLGAYKPRDTIASASHKQTSASSHPRPQLHAQAQNDANALQDSPLQRKSFEPTATTTSYYFRPHNHQDYPNKRRRTDEGPPKPEIKNVKPRSDIFLNDAASEKVQISAGDAVVNVGSMEEISQPRMTVHDAGHTQAQDEDTDPFDGTIKSYHIVEAMMNPRYRSKNMKPYPNPSSSPDPLSVDNKPQAVGRSTQVTTQQFKKKPAQPGSEMMKVSRAAADSLERGKNQRTRAVTRVTAQDLMPQDETESSVESATIANPVTHNTVRSQISSPVQGTCTVESFERLDLDDHDNPNDSQGSDIIPLDAHGADVPFAGDAVIKKSIFSSPEMIENQYSAQKRKSSPPKTDSQSSIRKWKLFSYEDSSRINILSDKTLRVIFDHDTKVFHAETARRQLSDCEVTRIIRFYNDEDSIHIKLRRGVQQGRGPEWIHMQFNHEDELKTFRKILCGATPRLNAQEKDQAQIKKILQTARELQTTTRPVFKDANNPRTRQQDQISVPEKQQNERVKIIDRLRNPNATENPFRKSSIDEEKGHDSMVEHQQGIIPKVSEFRANRRVTRLRASQAPHLQAPINIDETPSNTETPVKKHSETVGLGEPWPGPLVYPRKGPNKATVDFYDMKRLDEQEFLNDNLISFCLRYALEKSLNVNEKVHIFNSFFYETLTNSASGQKKFSYDLVKKWTAKTPLFGGEYNYVVVPINENFHWYVALICNLKKMSQQGEPQMLQIDSDVSVSTTHDTGSLSQGVDATTQESVSKNIPDNHIEKDNRTSSHFKKPATTSHLDVAAASKAASTKNKRKPPKFKFDSEEPYILILDSLHGNPTAVIRNLRDYVKAEARDKNDLTIPPVKSTRLFEDDLQGQDNFSDCGIYLIAYVAKFLENPRKFLIDLANGQLGLGSHIWKGLDPLKVRSSIRELLQHECKKQEAEKRLAKDSKSGGILEELQQVDLKYLQSTGYEVLTNFNHSGISRHPMTDRSTYRSAVTVPGSSREMGKPQHHRELSEKLTQDNFVHLDKDDLPKLPYGSDVHMTNAENIEPTRQPSSRTSLARTRSSGSPNHRNKLATSSVVELEDSDSSMRQPRTPRTSSHITTNGRDEVRTVQSNRFPEERSPSAATGMAGTPYGLRSREKRRPTPKAVQLQNSRSSTNHHRTVSLQSSPIFQPKFSPRSRDSPQLPRHSTMHSRSSSGNNIIPNNPFSSTNDDSDEDLSRRPKTSGKRI